MAKWILWSARLETLADFPLHSYIQPSPVNLQCGLTPWRWATGSGRMAPSVFSTSSVKGSRNLGNLLPSGTVKTPPRAAPSSRALTPLTNLKPHHLQNLLAKTRSEWIICWTPRNPWVSSSWPPWCPARPAPALSPPHTVIQQPYTADNSRRYEQTNKHKKKTIKYGNFLWRIIIATHHIVERTEYTTIPPPSLPQAQHTWYLIFETQPVVRIFDFCTSHLSKNKTFIQDFVSTCCQPRWDTARCPISWTCCWSPTHGSPASKFKSRPSPVPNIISVLNVKINIKIEPSKHELCTHSPLSCICYLWRKQATSISCPPITVQPNPPPGPIKIQV